MIPASVTMPLGGDNHVRAAAYPYAVRQALALAAAIETGRLDIRMPDGAMFHVGGREPGPHTEMTVHDLGFATRVAKNGELGAAESYLAGEWDSPDLAAFLEIFARNQPVIQRLLDGKPLVRLAQVARHWLNRNTHRGARRNIEAHYDLGNAFYGEWLDTTMTYSAALFDQGTAPDLAAAQTRKYEALARDTAIEPDQHVLEIGCGWGGFAQYAAQTIGCRVTALTISPAQFAFARQRVFEAGLAEKVDIKLQDYRDETGRYDRVASIEMFEAVGEAYWPTYFAKLAERLKPRGLAGLQVITIRDDLFRTYRRELDFIRRYIFPGGMLPTPSALHSLGARHGLRVAAERRFGLDYAETLTLWRQRFRAAWPRLTGLGFDERFRRMWEYYFAYCEAGFRAGTIDVQHIVYAKP